MEELFNLIYVAGDPSATLTKLFIVGLGLMVIGTIIKNLTGRY